MKLRALPQSFWVQPNAADTVSPTTFLPPIEDSRPTACEDCDLLRGDSRVVGSANTDLLFSLFNNIPGQYKPTSHKRPRGRPRKIKNVNANKEKDDDPYVTSAIVPQIKVQSYIEPTAVTEEKKVLALMGLHTIGVEPNNSSLQSTYAQQLHELVVNL